MQLAEVAVTQAGTQRSRQQTPTTPTAASKPRSGVDILKRLRENRARQQDVAINEDLTEEVAALREADAILTVELDGLNRQKGGRHQPKGSLQAQEILQAVDEKTILQKDVQRQLADILKESPAAHTEGTRRYNFRQEALEVADSNRQLIGSVTVADIRGRIAGAVDAGLIVVASDKDTATFSFDKQGYSSVWPNDSSVSDVAASLKELIEDLQSRNDDRDNAIVAELVRGGFYISARRDPDATRKGEFLDSELDLFRKEQSVVRKVSEFLAGNGQFYVAHVGRGFVVLEHRNGKFLAVKASNAQAGRFYFTRPDRQAENGARVAVKSAPEINQAGTTVTATDVSGVVDNHLRQALEEDLRRETESAERRETADGLRDISQLENPLTFGSLMEGEVGTVPVSISYEDPENNRRHTVTFQVTSNGTTFSVTGTVPGTEETIKRVKRDRTTRKIVSSKPFLPDFIGKETPIVVLESDPLWRLVRELNREFEVSWQLTREAGQRKAIRVSAENLDGLVSVENGQDGEYAVRATIRKNVADRGQKPVYRYNPVGYTVERKGSTVEIVWAVPGTSVAFANELRGVHEIGGLPWRFRLILGNLHWSVRKTDAPEHLRLTKSQSEDGDTGE
ncbi:MAG: hypothetical protein Q8R55_04215 [Candidatus Taylorbacteria bacterium]|nr:hypothetical protein [Candidatus Taylorbacteria bacterium]